MDWKNLYTSMDGRINRRTFWIGIVILVVVAIVLSFILAPLFGVGMMMGNPADAAAVGGNAGWYSLVMFVIFVWPGAALLIKRRHDKGGSGNDVWAFYGLQLVNIICEIIGIGAVVMALSFVIFIFAIYLLVVCGFLKGDEGANTFGPDPLGAPA